MIIIFFFKFSYIFFLTWVRFSRCCTDLAAVRGCPKDGIDTWTFYSDNNR